MTSTINITQPAANAQLSSTPIRQNFAAAANDINALQNLSINVSGDAVGVAAAIPTTSNTTVNLSLTLASSGVAPGTYSSITVNSKGIITAGSQNITFGAGTAASPGLQVIGNTSTGLYQPTPNNLSVTAGGKEALRIVGSNTVTNFVQISASASGSPLQLIASGTDTNIDIAVSPKGTGWLSVSGNKVLTAGFMLTGDVTGNAVVGATNVQQVIAELASSGVNAGTYNATIIDAKGRATTGIIQNQRFSLRENAPSNSTYPIVDYCEIGGKIQQILYRVTSGTITANIKINGQSITGASALACTTTLQSVTPTGAQIFFIGDNVEVTFSSGSSPGIVSLTIIYAPTFNQTVDALGQGINGGGGGVITNSNILTCSNNFQNGKWELFNGAAVASGLGPVLLTFTSGNKEALDSSPQGNVFATSTQYTFQAKLATQTGTSTVYPSWFDGTTDHPGSAWSITTTPTVFTYTFTTGASFGSGTPNIAITNIDPGATFPAAAVLVQQLKLELGASATTYGGDTPCPNPNMLLCSGNLLGSVWTVSGGASIVSSGGGSFTLTLGNTQQAIAEAVSLIANTTYTFSATVSATSGSIITPTYFDGSTNNIGAPWSLTGSPQRFTFTFTTGASTAGATIGLSNDGGGSQAAPNPAVTAVITQPKLEIGSIASAYGIDTSCPSTAGALGYLIGCKSGGGSTTPSIINGWLGRNVDCAGPDFNTFGGINSSSYNPVNTLAAGCTFPMISIYGEGNLTDMNAAASGTYDSAYTTMIRNALSNTSTSGNKLVSVRIGWECNGNWYPWAVGGTANFINAFRRIAQIVRANYAGVLIEWNINLQFNDNQWAGSSGANPLAYFPGAYNASTNPGGCNILGMDFYEDGSGGVGSMPSIIAAKYGLNWAANFCQTNGLKMGLPEWAAGDGRNGSGSFTPSGLPGLNDGQWVQQCIDWINSLPPGLFAYSNYADDPPADDIASVGANPAEQQAWKNSWGNTHFDRTIGGWWTGAKSPSEP